MRIRSLLLSLTLAASPAALAQSSCPEGKVASGVKLPNGRIQLVCLPAAAVDGQGKAPTGAPVGSTCPCFSFADVEAAVRASDGVYTYSEPAYYDPFGNQCKYKEVATRRFGIFAAMVKTDLPQEPCITPKQFPLSDVNPNGCYRQDETGTVLLRGISPAESLACAVTLVEFHP